MASRAPGTPNSVGAGMFSSSRSPAFLSYGEDGECEVARVGQLASVPFVETILKQRSASAVGAQLQSGYAPHPR